MSVRGAETSEIGEAQELPDAEWRVEWQLERRTVAGSVEQECKKLIDCGCKKNNENTYERIVKIIFVRNLIIPNR